MWNKYYGKEFQDRYNLNGNISLEISTSEGNFTKQIPVAVEVKEFPF
jgi:hypothetical protein